MKAEITRRLSCSACTRSSPRRVILAPAMKQPCVAQDIAEQQESTAAVGVCWLASKRGHSLVNGFVDVEEPLEADDLNHALDLRVQVHQLEVAARLLILRQDIGQRAQARA